jgi:hypothetical protein
MSPLTPREDKGEAEVEPCVAVGGPVVEPMEGDAVNPEVGLSDWLLGNTGLVVTAPGPFSVCCGLADPGEVRSLVP